MFVSTGRLSKTFTFHYMYDDHPMHLADIWPQGPNMLVSVNSMSALTNSLVDLSNLQLKVIIDSHAALMNIIVSHSCHVLCPSVLIVFRLCNRPRLAKRVSNTLPKTKLSAKAKGK